MLDAYREVREGWEDDYRALEEETRRIRTVLEREFGVVGDVGDAVPERKRLRQEESRATRAEDEVKRLRTRISEAEAETEQQTARRDDGMRLFDRLQEQLTTLRELLNPMQKQSLSGLLRSPRPLPKPTKSILKQGPRRSPSPQPSAPLIGSVNSSPQRRASGQHESENVYVDQQDLHHLQTPDHGQASDTTGYMLVQPPSPGSTPYKRGPIGGQAAQEHPGGLAPGWAPRARRHFLKDARDFVRHRCRRCHEHIGIRTKHKQCTQCHQRYHAACEPQVTADCRPAPFTCVGGDIREAPPIGSNLQGAIDVRSLDPSAEPLVPGVVNDTIAAIERRGMKIQGLYKTQEGTAGQVKTLLESYFVFPAATDGARATSSRPNFQTVTNMHEVAGVLKRFLRELDEPVISYDTYTPIVEAAKHEYDPANANPRLCQLLAQLAPAQFYTLRYVVEHLTRVIAVSENEMDVNAISRVFARCFFRSPMGDLADLKDNVHQVEATKRLLQLPSTSWDSVEVLVEQNDVTTTASPIPDDKQEKQVRSARKALKSSRTTPLRRPHGHA
eukprot:m.209459 g.209459  ORF g.209459 m.209459 type:complete len:558 (+) comp24608_c0_seq1:191-1864(+)